MLLVKGGRVQRARDDFALVISNQECPLKKRLVIAHMKTRSKHSFLTINYDKKKQLIKHVGVFQALCCARVR